MDRVAGDSIYLKFTTVDSSGVPTTLGGTPAIIIYKDQSLDQSSTGVTLATDFDGVTGLNAVQIDTDSDPVFYSDGGDFQVVIGTGTVGAASVVGYVVGQFSLGKVKASLSDYDAPNRSDLFALESAVTGAETQILEALLEVPGDVWDEALAQHLNPGSTGQALAQGGGEGGGDWSTSERAQIRDRLGIDGAIEAASAIPSLGAVIADRLLGRALQGGVDGGRTVRQALRRLRNRNRIAANVLSIYAEDDSTVDWSANVDTSPGNPITEVNPS